MLQTSIDWQTLFRHLPAPCLVLDRDLNIVTASDQYLQTVQRDLDEITGQYVFDAFPEEGERLEMFENAFRRAIAGEANALVEVPYSIPVVDAEGHPTGERREIWWTCKHNPVVEADGSIRYMVQNAQDVTKQVKAEQLKDAVTQELQHRVGNIFSLVTATAKRTLQHSADFDDFLKKFDGRMMSLARTHSYLTGEHWDDMTIDKIVYRELSEYSDANDEQITAEGDSIVLNASEAQILTLAVHELVTNAVKHGALKNADGRLSVRWTVQEGQGYIFDWQEEVGEIAQIPERRGFGSFILDSVVPAQLSGVASRQFTNDSFRYQLTVADRNSAA